jgi:hypothetical protein
MTITKTRSNRGTPFGIVPSFANTGLTIVVANRLAASAFPVILIFISISSFPCVGRVATRADLPWSWIACCGLATSHLKVLFEPRLRKIGGLRYERKDELLQGHQKWRFCTRTESRATESCVASRGKECIHCASRPASFRMELAMACT